MQIGNHFIDTLAVDARAAILDHASLITVEADRILVAQDRPIDTVHFPTTAVLSLEMASPSGRSLQTAVVGREGLSGLIPFLADADSPTQISCETTGSAFAVPAAQLRRLAWRHADLMQRLLVLACYYQGQANQIAVCSALHSIEQRVARWMLMADDVSGSRRLIVSQAQIANRMGVQRTSIVEAFRGLTRGGAVEHSRGWVKVVDRAALERRACGCYRNVRALGERMAVLPVIPKGEAPPGGSRDQPLAY